MRDRDAMVAMTAGMIATGDLGSIKEDAPGLFDYRNDERMRIAGSWIDLAEYMVDEIVARGDKREES